MKFIAAVLIGIILIAGCHPTVHYKPSKGNPDEMSSDTMSTDSFYSYDISNQMIYPYVDPVDEMIAQNQDDANQIPAPPDANEPNTAQPPTDEPQPEPAGAIEINMTASMTFDIAPGKTYTMTFAIPGRYKYICKLHETAGMIGQITVMPLSQ